MGWYFGPQTRRELITELTEPRNNGRTSCLRYCLRGNVLWSLWQDPAGRYIGCDLLARHGDQWGHKPMCESVHPYYYTCPVAYLDECPDVANEEWRAIVRERAARTKQQKAER